MPPALTLLGPPYYEAGSGCPGTTTIDCNLDYIANGATTKVILELRATTAGNQTVTATATADQETNLSNNTVTTTIHVDPRATANPPSVPAQTPAKAASVSLTGVAVVGHTLAARPAIAKPIIAYQWQVLRAGGHWHNIRQATHRTLKITADQAGTRLRVRAKTATTTIYSPASPLVRRR